MTPDRNGYQIYCIVTDANGNRVKSDTVTISMAAVGPVITAQPKNTTAANGSSVKLTVAATGEDLTYQWYYKVAGNLQFQKSSRTTNAYTNTMTPERNGYQVYCVITDANGISVTTDTVTISMEGAAPVITTQPQNVTAANGNPVKLTVAAAGEGLTYQWYFKGANSMYFQRSSQSTATYTTTMNAARNGYQIYCVVMDAQGNSVKSKTVTISMAADGPVITAQPQDITAAKNQPVNLTVAAQGEDLTYQWYYKTANTTQFQTSGQTTNTYTTTMTAAIHGQQFYCVVTDVQGNSVKSNTVTVSMAAAGPVITAQPRNTSAVNGNSVNLTIAATGEDLTYQWYYKAAGSAQFQKSSRTTCTYTTTMTAERDGYQLYCVITDIYGNSVKSNTVTITKEISRPVITTQPRSVAVANGSSVTLTVGASGEGLTYQWYFKGANSMYYQKSSQTTATYTTTMTEARNGYQLYCVITDANGVSVTSNTVTISIG